MSPAGIALPLTGRYRLARRLPPGGCGEVWQATDEMLARPVAVKLLCQEVAGNPAVLARFGEDARRTGALSHENIVRIYDYEEPGDPHWPFLVMEFVDGPSLAEALAGGPVGPARVVDIVAQCAAGLHAAHQGGLVHGGIKPRNILLGPDGRVKLTDFGFSRAVTRLAATTGGTPPAGADYLAPEQVNGAWGTVAADLYALGVVARECLTGRPPHEGAAAPAAPWPPEVPAEVAALVSELVADNPADRPADAGQVARRAGRLRDRMLAAGNRVAPAGRSPAPGLVPGVRAAGRRGALRRHGLDLVAVAAATIALAAALVAAMLAFTPHRTSAGAPGPATVAVAESGLRGLPVSTVCGRLHRLGLRTRVRWASTSAVPPGDVLSLSPVGRVPRGSTVEVTGARRPADAGPPAQPAVAPAASASGQRPGGASPAPRPDASHRSPPGGSATPAPSSPGPTASPTGTGSPSPTPSPTSTASPTPTTSPSPTGSPS